VGSLIHYEGWDGVSAPSIPPGWTVSPPLATSSSPTGGISPLSSPNVLACASTGSNTHYPAAYSVADGGAGNVLVYASFSAASTTNNQTFGVFARGSAYPLVITSSTYYWAQLSPNGATCKLYAVVGGMQTALATVSGITLSDDVWYQIQLNCQQSTITVTVSRASDGYYLNSAGSFQSAATSAILVTDTSVTGAGYAGLTLQSRSDNAYSDEWYFYGYTGSQQAPIIRAQPILQRARSRGQIIQPLAVRFGTPVVPLLMLSHGIVSRDTSRRRAAIDKGGVRYPPWPMPGAPGTVNAIAWKTVKWADPSKLRRRIAPGVARTPRWWAPPGVPPSVNAINWKTVRSLERSRPLCRIDAGRVWMPAALPVPGSNVNSGWTQQYITQINPPVQYGTELFLSWTSDAPPGLVFQVYENDVLVWSGVSPYCTLPLPTSLARFDVGTVGISEQNVSFESLLPPLPVVHAELTWLGGTFEGSDIAGFHVYGEEAQGAGINYGSILETIPAYTAGIITDGFGYGGFGQGGYGESAGSYSWTSEPLSSGVWHFAVVPFDTSGNEGTGVTTAVTIVAPPGEPVPFADRSRLHYVYSATTHEVALTWNPSPG
jgi:hypothetical protein